MFLSALLFTLGTLPSAPYQLGNEWGKKVIDAASYAANGPVYKRAALATAFLPQAGGTAFYLGKFNGMHVLATNRHVCETGASCLSGDAVFPLLNRKYTLSYFIVSVKEIDLALVTIDVPPADEPLFQNLGRNFSFHREVQFHEPLLTLGYGGADNPNRVLTANQDSDCVVASPTATYYPLKDPDTQNPMPDAVWSFANGCDVSPGDSGSPMINRNTGEIIGLIWTGTVPKKPETKSSAWLQQIETKQTSDVWTQLSYAVPATKMPEALLQATTTIMVDAPRKALILKILE